MKLLASILLLASSAFALSVTQGPVVSATTHAGTRVNWVTSAAAYSVWCWDTTSHPSATSCSPYSNNYGSNGTHTVHGMYFSGLTAGTTYYYRVGGSTSASQGGTVAVSSEGSFTTSALPNPHPAQPTAPTAVDNVFPTCANGRIEVCSGGNPVPVVVGSSSGSCDDPSDGLAARYASVAWGTVIQIPVNLTVPCRASYSLVPTAAGAWDNIGRIVVESQNASSLPQGVRVNPSDAGNMPTMLQSIYIHQNGSYTAQSYCYAGGLYWNDVPTTPDPGTGGNFQYMKYCGNSGTAGTVSNVVYVADTSGGEHQFTYAVTLSVAAGVTPSVGQWGYMTGVGGIPKANGSFQVVSVASSTSFNVTMYNSYLGSSSVTYTSGGTVQFFDWQTVSYTSYTGASPSGSCTPGTTAASAWAYSTTNPVGSALTGNISVGSMTNTNYSSARVWRCTAPNVWSPHYIDNLDGGIYVSAFPQTATLDLSQATHTWIVGLNFTNAPVYNDPLLYHSGWSLGSGEADILQGGSAPNFNIYNTGASLDNHIDRCLFTRQWPAKGNQFIQMNGTELTLTNSYVQNLANSWWGHEDRGTVYDDAAGAPIYAGCLNGGLVDNNYIEAYGISIHFDDLCIGTGLHGVANNITTTRNTFYRNLALIDEAPGSTVNYYTPLRQLWEAKSCVDCDINGNTFTNNFQNVSQAAAIDLTPEWIGEGGGGIYCTLAYTGSSGLFTLNDSYGYTVNVGDWIWLSGADSTHIEQVTAVNPGANQFTVGTMVTLGLSSPVFLYVLTGGDGVSNINIRNNTFNNVPTVITSYSHVSHEAQPTRISVDFVAIQNNVVNQLGPGGATGPLNLPPSEAWFDAPDGNGGFFWEIWGGQVDWVNTHNTIYNFNLNPYLSSNSGTMTSFINNDFPVINTNEGEGIVYQNNMEWANAVADIASSGSPSGLTCSGNGNAIFTCWTSATGNLPFIVSGNASYLPGGNPGGYSTPNYWANFTGAASPFDNNLNLLYNSCCISGGPHSAIDKLSQGANIGTLNAAQYTVIGARAMSISATGATISFAPLGANDITNGCSVDWTLDGTFQTGIHNVAGSSGMSQNVSITTSPANATVFWRVNCQAQRPTGRIR